MSKKLALEWLESARADIKTIEHIVNDEGLTHIVAFHTQQCVEKCLKALLEFWDRPVPKEHSTIRLYGLVADAPGVELDRDLLTDLDDLYINARYPGELGLLPQGLPTLQDARQFYEFAADMYQKVQTIIAG
ncbi:HEPN domain-containing protein [Candidatus Parcubacteria bacterium]|nr:MAG: HEPN domain-containing protein [Candidatus Parcubacteria bacterium]